eukprot:11226645-Lingulodinium_polyedra.AAC.1
MGARAPSPLFNRRPDTRANCWGTQKTRRGAAPACQSAIKPNQNAANRRGPTSAEQTNNYCGITRYDN